MDELRLSLDVSFYFFASLFVLYDQFIVIGPILVLFSLHDIQVSVHYEQFLIHSLFMPGSIIDRALQVWQGPGFLPGSVSEHGSPALVVKNGHLRLEIQHLVVLSDDLLSLVLTLPTLTAHLLIQLPILILGGLDLLLDLLDFVLPVGAL